MAKKKVEEVKGYALSAKESKALADTENKSQLAIIYRAVDAAPTTFEDIWKSVRDTMHKAPRGGETEKRQTNVRTYLHRLCKQGLVKRVKVRDAVAGPVEG